MLGVAVPGLSLTAREGAPDVRRPLLTIVVPVFNGGETIVANVATIRRLVAQGLPGEEFEVVVVSDGSIDGTAERLLEAEEGEGTRVIHYDRNLGKGYAVKAGALAASGAWVALVDSDLDLDPGAIPGYLEIARREQLDFAIGSKRHPDSVVAYPRSRRIASWCYQQLNRLLFGLEVRDTQVGLKVFSRRVADDVLPLLLVKRFAFDLELLAVAAALGHGRVKELPVRLEYRFTGSQVRSRAVVRALLDTAAIFYRLRILRTYQRKRLLTRPRTDFRPTVVVDGSATDIARQQDYPALEPCALEAASGGGLVARVAPGARPAGNWVAASVPFFAASDVAAVVCPTVAPTRGPLRDRLSAAVLESRLGGGSRRMRHVPGNLRLVADHPAENVVARRSDIEAARAANVSDRRLVAWLAERGRRTVYTPDTVVVQPPPPALRPLLRAAAADGRARGVVARRTRGRSASGATLAAFAATAAGAVGVGLLLLGEDDRAAPGATLIGASLAVFGTSAVTAGVRFRSGMVGVLLPPTVLATQAAYFGGFAVGLAESSGVVSED
jgi:glycosyltransferase involved in cell wall biosynthesis